MLLFFAIFSAKESLAEVKATSEKEQMTLVVLGDSLSAGYQLDSTDAFPAKLQKALTERDYKVHVINAGVSGDTSSGGLARLEWSISPNTNAVIIELGGNDALRGIDPHLTRDNINAIIENLQQRNIAVLLTGMLAPPNLGSEYSQAFNSIFPNAAKRHNVFFYPFFLDGVAGNSDLNLPDGIHPTASGVDVIVERILPQVEHLLDNLKKNDS